MVMVAMQRDDWHTTPGASNEIATERVKINSSRPEFVLGFSHDQHGRHSRQPAAEPPNSPPVAVVRIRVAADGQSTSTIIGVRGGD